MEEIDNIENRISLFEPHIDIEEIIDSYLSETFAEEEMLVFDTLGFRKSKVAQLKYRFTEVYNLNILDSENGVSLIIVVENEDVNIKKYLHRFLSYKSVTGGENANADGSAELFEDISANAVKNYLGEGAKSIMVGEGGQNLTEERLTQISEEMFENTGVYHNLPNQAKDDGVDFIVYKPIDDRNIGNIIILGQACVGKYYNRKKTIHQRWQDEYITYSIKPPTTLLSIVSFLETDQLKKVHSEFGNALVFDKGRIMRYFSISDQNLNNKIIAFVNNNIDEE